MLAYRIMGLAARLLLALGAACFLLGGYLVWHTLAFSAEAAQADGKVVSYREVRDGDAVRYRPRVRFKTETGEIVTFDGELSTTTQRFAIGAAVPVVYQRSKPPQARISTFADDWLGATAAGVVGLLAFAAGFLVRRAVRRDTQASA